MISTCEYTIYRSVTISVTMYWSYFKTVLIKAKTCNWLLLMCPLSLRYNNARFENIYLYKDTYLSVKFVYFLNIRLILNIFNCFCPTLHLYRVRISQKLKGYSVKPLAYCFYRKAKITSIPMCFSIALKIVNWNQKLNVNHSLKITRIKNSLPWTTSDDLIHTVFTPNKREALIRDNKYTLKKFEFPKIYSTTKSSLNTCHNYWQFIKSYYASMVSLLKESSTGAYKVY